MNLKHLVGVALLVLSSSVLAQRTAPGCHFEQIVMDDLRAKLNSQEVLSGAEPPPGTFIDVGPIGDPLYSAPGWEKRGFTVYMRQTLKPKPWEFQRYVQRYTVHMHFMWNTNTRQSDQIKFKTTYEQGCVGEKTIAGAWIEGEATSGASVMSQPDLFSMGYSGSWSWGRNAHIFERSMTVTVGPLMIIQSGLWTTGQGFGTASASGGCAQMCLDTDL